MPQKSDRPRRAAATFVTDVELSAADQRRARRALSLLNGLHDSHGLHVLHAHYRGRSRLVVFAKIPGGDCDRCTSFAVDDAMLEGLDSPRH